MESSETVSGSTDATDVGVDAGVASVDMEHDRAVRDVHRWATRLDFVTYIGVGPRKAGRQANAKILARLGLHLCFDAALYPFPLCEIQSLDHADDLGAALAFLAEQAGPGRSRWDASELEEPNSGISRLLRMAE